MSISGMFPSTGFYLNGGDPVFFDVQGWTNADSGNTLYFEFNSYADVDGTGINTGYLIDTYDKLGVKAVPGSCKVLAVLPNDTYAIYATPSNYTVTVECDHEIFTTYGMRLTFPSDYYVWPNGGCTVGAFNGTLEGEVSAIYGCVANNETNTIEITAYSEIYIPELTEFTFTVDSIRNPGTWEVEGDIFFENLSNSGNAIDSGYWHHNKDEYDAFNYTTIDYFTVTSDDYRAGHYEATYTF